MHTPNEFPTALKDLFIQHFEIHGYNTRNKYDLHATDVNTKIYGHKKLSYITRHAVLEFIRLPTKKGAVSQEV